MCGIAGVVELDGRPVAPVVVRRMGDAIVHRGPDGEGWWCDGEVGLAHRRLAIIDLSTAGHQPMATADGRFVLNYNGELYNYQELRAELEAAGWRFRSQSDTEVVLHALAQWGKVALPRLNGMFALALWDRDRRSLLLARDRFGVKPLYHSTRGSTFLFGSEIKAMLQHPKLATSVDVEALFEYFTFQNLFTDRTLFADVRLLPAGTCLEVDRRGVGSYERWWDFEFSEPDRPAEPMAYVEELERLFQQAVSRQLVSDVAVGSYLSGGTDSASITAVAAGQLASLPTFTIGFDLRSASGLELGYDERETAEHISYLFGTEQYEMVLKAGDLERVMDELIWHLEDPRVGQCYPNYYAAKLASRFSTVVLGGTGGDELFGGYPWRYYRAAVNDSFDHYVDKYYDFWNRLVPTEQIDDLFAPVHRQVASVSTRDIMRDVFATHASELLRPEDYINHSLYFEAKTFLHGLLVVEDKLSMAHSLESRVPFLDNDLVDFAQRVPVGLKLGNLAEVVRLNENEPGPKTERFYQRTRDGKLLLREAMRRFVPDDVAGREKQGFSAPDASWFRGESIDWVRRVLLDGSPRIYEYLDAKVVHDLLDDHFAGKVNRRLLIWSLLSVETWLQRFVP